MTHSTKFYSELETCLSKYSSPLGPFSACEWAISVDLNPTIRCEIITTGPQSFPHNRSCRDTRCSCPSTKGFVWASSSLSNVDFNENPGVTYSTSQTLQQPASRPPASYCVFLYLIEYSLTYHFLQLLRNFYYQGGGFGVII